MADAKIYEWPQVCSSENGGSPGHCPPDTKAEPTCQTGKTQLTEGILNHIYILILFIKQKWKLNFFPSKYLEYFSYSRPAEQTYEGGALGLCILTMTFQILHWFQQQYFSHFLVTTKNPAHIIWIQTLVGANIKQIFTS